MCISVLHVRYFRKSPLISFWIIKAFAHLTVSLTRAHMIPYTAKMPCSAVGNHITSNLCVAFKWGVKDRQKFSTHSVLILLQSLDPHASDKKEEGWWSLYDFPWRSGVSTTITRFDDLLEDVQNLEIIVHMIMVYYTKG